MMKQLDQQFFSLLRTGLWGTEPQVSLFTGETDWEALFLMAKEQTVVPTVADGVESLLSRTDLEIPREVRKKFASGLLKTEQRNARMDRLSSYLFRKAEAEGIPCVILKGQGVARCYPNPLRRQSGDVDVVVLPENFERICALFTPDARKIEQQGEGTLHRALYFGDLEVEFHGSIESELTHRTDTRLEELHRELLAEGGIRILEEGDLRIPVPSVRFDTQYLLSHLYKHFFQEGLGLRQVCDWMMFVHSHADELEPEVLAQELRKIGLEYAWGLFSAFCVRYLGATRFPLCPDVKDSVLEKVWDLMALHGNFGKKTFHGWAEGAYVIKKVTSLFRAFPQVAEKVGVAPGDSLRFFLYYFRRAFLKLKKGV